MSHFIDAFAFIFANGMVGLSFAFVLLSLVRK